jgi:hypothetical protein
MSRGAAITLLVTFALGLGLGLYVGWVALPVEYVNTAPASLREPAKDEAVLMIATAYAGDQDLETARARLAELGYTDPGPEVAATAGRFLAGAAPETDLRRLATLVAAFGPVPPELQAYLP